MTTKLEKAAIKLAIAKHIRKYDAPYGKRRCMHGLTDDCLIVAVESKFLGLICKPCQAYKQRQWYDGRMIRRGLEGNPVKCRGRPLGSKDKPKIQPAKTKKKT